jgi:hypothetical protein
MSLFNSFLSDSNYTSNYELNRSPGFGLVFVIPDVDDLAYDIDCSDRIEHVAGLIKEQKRLRLAGWTLNRYKYTSSVDGLEFVDHKLLATWHLTG